VPVTQKLLRIAATATGLIVEGDNLGARLQIITAIGPQIGFLGFTLAGIELRHGRLIGVQAISLQ
jgi:hypothetical protein